MIINCSKHSKLNFLRKYTSQNIVTIYVEIL